MPKRSDPVESLAKVLRAAKYPGRPIPSHKVWMEIRGDYRAMARAAIAHLSKPTPCKPGTIRQRVAAINRVGNAKPKRGAKRGK